MTPRCQHQPQLRNSLPVNVSFPVPVSFSLQKPCQSIRAFPDDHENYENF